MISFSFDTKSFKRNEYLVENGFIWSSGHICIANQQAIIIFEDVPVVGILYALYERISRFEVAQRNPNNITDDDTYNFDIYMNYNEIEIRPGWGYSNGTSFLQDKEDFMLELRIAIKNAYMANCLINNQLDNIELPETLAWIIATS